METKLCNFCEQLPPISYLQDGVYDHQPSLCALKISADGCALCNLFWQALIRSNNQDDILARLDGHSSNLNISSTADTYIQVQAECYFPGFVTKKENPGKLDGIVILVGGQAGLWARLDLYATRGDQIAQQVKGREVNQDPFSDLNFKIIDRWLQRCVENHKMCLPPIDAALPTRVLNVGPEDGSREPHLCETNDLEEKGKYVTLSYCWGKSQPTILTTQSLEAMKKNIQLSSLPKTLQDAVITTRRLRIRYLWIDALCIIQDSDEDWQKEAANMGQIYKNSFLTIQGAATVDCSEGFFTKRSQPAASPLRLRYSRLGDEPISYIYARLPISIEAGSADTRAWIFQESILPRRLLVYGQAQMFLKCHSGVRWEDGSYVSEVWQPLPKGRTGPSFFKPLKEPSLFDMRLNLLENWYLALAFTYTATLLTKGRDRLPALSGVVQEMQSIIGGRYLAGVWEADLIKGLLWKCRYAVTVARYMISSGTHGFLTKVSTYRAPSWSWAAYEGAIYYDSRSERTLAKYSKKEQRAKVLDIWTIPAGLNPFGEVKDGQLQISGPLGVATTIGCDDHRYFKLKRKSKSSFRHIGFCVLLPVHKSGLVQPKAPEASLTPGDSKHQVISNVIVEERSVGMAAFDTKDDRPTIVWCLLLISHEGLLLDCVDGDGQKFRRVGFFVLQDPDWLGRSNETSITII
ncbi:MAG: hypothetical protein M1834_009132 [Cirrosporium novae-zelandiae]|nr:MAG: hypothetical protein M1834_009132 [Cirrosporium novae-zelandiae]